MRSSHNTSVGIGLLLASLAVVPLAAQPSSGPMVIHPLQRPLPPATDEPALIKPPPNEPTLVFDADSKRYDASPGEQVAPFTFNLTNVWTNEIIIDKIKASCTCTTAAMPSDPWHIPPNGSGQVKAQMILRGKMGLVSKPLTFYYRMPPEPASYVHQVNLVVNVEPPPSINGKMSEAERAAARAKARADAQAIFKGDCSSCHANKGRGKMGQELYAADCGICHESPHRESAVPDLHALKQVTDFDYWKTIITLGKPTNMMPAFAASQGGPLTEEQIVSLATYLNHTISHNLSTASANTGKE